MKIILIYLILLMSACGSAKKSTKQTDASPKDLKESLIEANKIRMEMEGAQIDGYIKRRKWDMIKTGTGLRYMIYQRGEGTQLAKKGTYAKIAYTIELIDGTKCYSTEKSGPREVLIGMDQIESGIHEGLTYLKAGDKAKFILPSYLAHGLIGDREKIPAKSTIIYDLHLISIR